MPQVPSSTTVHDVVVVGSGAGGGTVTNVLANANDNEREGILASGLMEAEEVDAAIELCADPRLSTLSPVMMTAWGRRRS